MQLILLLPLLAILASCGNPIKILKNEIKKSGHMMYQNPIAHAGTGTLIGGTPNYMMYVADPQTCFSDDKEIPIKLRRFDEIVLPNIAKTINVSGKQNAELINILKAGNAPIGIGVDFSYISSITLTFEKVQLEYLDAVAIKYYYDNVMDQICKDFLDQVGFITQAIKVGKMRFEFTNSRGNKISLSTPTLQRILKLGSETQYQIQNKYSLVISSPKYLGYQLGQLRKQDHGYVFYRATSSKNNHYLFDSINVFSGISSKSLANNLRYSIGYREQISEASIVTKSIYRNL